MILPQESPSEVVCPDCDGQGYWNAEVASNGRKFRIRCMVCSGHKTIPQKHLPPEQM